MFVSIRLAMKASTTVSEEEYVAPRNELEERIAEIWRGALQVDRVAVNTNFFDLGGHSLIAIRLMARIHNEVGVRLQLAAIFEAPTIADPLFGNEVADQFRGLYDRVTSDAGGS